MSVGACRCADQAERGNVCDMCACECGAQPGAHRLLGEMMFVECFKREMYGVTRLCIHFFNSSYLKKVLPTFFISIAQRQRTNFPLEKRAQKRGYF